VSRITQLRFIPRALLVEPCLPIRRRLVGLATREESMSSYKCVAQKR